MSVFLTVLVPLLTAAVLLAFWTRPRLRRFIALVGSLVHVLSATNLLSHVLEQGVVTKNLGSWPAPFGIAFQADILSGLLVTVAAVIGLFVNVYSSENLEPDIRDFGFHPVFFVLLTGVSGAFVTNDLFNLFVWFECILLSSFVLLALGGTTQQIRGAMNYVVPNLFSSMLFLSGLGLIYGSTGTLNMNDLAVQLRFVPTPVLTVISLVFFVAFGIKAALFPFSSWLPTSYHTPPVAITALFAGLLTKVGVYALIRFFTKIAPLDSGPVTQIMVVAAVVTMVGGILPAIGSTNIKKILAYNIISHIGVLLAGLCLNSSISLMGTTGYLVHHIFTVTGLFLVVGIIEKHYGSADLQKVCAVAKECPVATWLFAILALALIGFPPLSGFWPKLMLVQSSAQHGQFVLTGAILFSSFGTLLSLGRVWTQAFWTPSSGSTPQGSSKTLNLWPKYAPSALIALTVSILGIFPSLLTGPSARVADQLLQRSELIKVPPASSKGEGEK